MFGLLGYQKLQVCDVCGVYFSRLDNDRCLVDYFFGKMYLGFVQMRKVYEFFFKEMRGRYQGGGGGGGGYGRGVQQMDDDMGYVFMGLGGGFGDGWNKGL